MGPTPAICAVRCASQKPPLRRDAFSMRFALSLRKSTAMSAAMGASLGGRCRDVVNLGLHHRNCLGIIVGHRNSFAGDLSDIRTVIAGELGPWGEFISCTVTKFLHLRNRK